MTGPIAVAVPAGVAVGDILIEGGTYFPNSMTKPGESSVPGWSAVNCNRPTFEKEVDDAGWTLFFMAGDIKTTVFGFNRQKTLRSALKRLVATVKSQSCNSIEITQVKQKSFLKFPYVSVWAHVRHLQKGQGLVFSGRR
jgi:hypothetical protein